MEATTVIIIVVGLSLLVSVLLGLWSGSKEKKNGGGVNGK